MKCSELEKQGFKIENVGNITFTPIEVDPKEELKSHEEVFVFFEGSIRKVNTSDIVMEDEGFYARIMNRWAVFHDIFIEYKKKEALWGFDELRLAKRCLGKLDMKSYRLNTFVEAKKVLSTEQWLKEFDAFTSGFWSKMYGETGDFIWIDPYSVECEKDGKMCYIWGWPGPDYSLYSIEDYGRTWCLTREEIPEGEPIWD